MRAFYRGDWCPYCSLHLSEAGKNEEALLNSGCQIAGLSPDAPAALQESIKEQSLSYTLLSDSRGQLMEAMAVAFHAPEKYGKVWMKGSE